ncbi:MAG TPA: ATP-binding protein [Telluria sp.]|nr:ATP-binding protein [Telluria sp.]
MHNTDEFEPHLAAAMQAAPSEIYLFDSTTLKFVDVNQTARANLQYDFTQLQGMTPFDIAPGLVPARLHAVLEGLGEEIGAQACMRTRHRRADGSSYPITLHFLRVQRDGKQMIVALGDDRTAEHTAAEANYQYQLRFNTLASNMPGLVYQFVAHPDGSSNFPYLSEGCQSLLGVTVAQLQQQPGLFLKLILPEDRQSYLDTLQASTRALSPLNWEGRIWIDDFKDVKWINVRATPHALIEPRGTVEWDGIMTNITASRREQEEKDAAHTRLAELTAHIEEAKEQERTRIAREIHDDVGGNLTAIKMALTMLARRLPPDEALAKKADYVDSLVDRTIDAIHRISLDLRPSVLDFGIVPALEWQCAEFEKQNGIPCAFAAADKEIELNPDHATALFRVFQEALTNIAKHAKASMVTVRLQHQDGQLSLTVADNGVGIAPQDRDKPGSFGLLGMAERAQALGGTLKVSRATDGGTVVAINIPLINQDSR